MRTQGTFADIYNTAKIYSGDIDINGCPMNPVVRHANGVWMLESGINDEPNADAECLLEDFGEYFYECYSDHEYQPTLEDEADFLEWLKVGE